MGNEKEVYGIWVEYLKRSETYYEYCEFAKRNSCYDFLKCIKWKTDSELALTVSSARSFSMPRCDVAFWNGKYTAPIFSQDYSKKMIADATRLYYIVFGNIFENEIFDSWDDKFEPYLRNVQSSIDNSDVGSVSLFGSREFKSIAEWSMRDFSLRHYCGKSEELEDFVDHLSNEFDRFETILFQVDITKSKTTLLKSFGKILDELFIPYREKKVLHKRYVIPSDAVYVEELKRYLRLYDLKNEQKKGESSPSNRAIFKEIYNECSKLDADEMNKCRARASKELKYAERIICNVEHGLFPGTYAKTKKGCDPDLK